MRTSAFLFVVVTALTFVFTGRPVEYLQQEKSRYNIHASNGDEENPQARADYEFMMLRSPVSNRIPDNITRREQHFAKSLPSRESKGLAKGNSIQSLTWTERGPSNVGGRTRVLAADVATPGVLIAGSVAGGIWKSTNDGATWQIKITPDQIHTTSCISQDLRVGHLDTWYVGTGEFRGIDNKRYTVGLILSW